MYGLQSNKNEMPPLDVDDSKNYNVNIDNIEDDIEYSDKFINDIINDSDLMDVTYVIKEDIKEEALDSKIITNKLLDFGKLSSGQSSVTPGAGKPDININTTVSRYDTIVKHRDLKNYNQNKRHTYSKLIKYIQQKKFDKLKQIEIRNQKLKIIAIKIIYFLGSKALKLYISGTIAPLMMTWLVNPINILNPNGLDGMYLALETSGILPVHLISEFKTAIQLTSDEFLKFLPDESKDLFKKFLVNPSKDTFKGLESEWINFTTNSDGDSIIETALANTPNTNSEIGNKLVSFLNKKKNLLFSIPEDNESDTGKIIYSAYDLVFGKLSPGEQKDRFALNNLCLSIMSLNSMNSNYIGLLINSSNDILDITGNIISLNSNSKPNETPTTFLQQQMKGNIINVLSSTQLNNVLNKFFNKTPMYLFFKPGAECDATLLGRIGSGIWSITPSFGSTFTALSVSIVNSQFKIVPPDVSTENDKKKREKELIEKKIERRIELYKDENNTKQKIDNIIKNEFEKPEYKSMIFKQLHKIFVEKNVQSITTFIAFVSTAALSIELINGISAIILASDSDNILSIFTTMLAVLGALNDGEEGLRYGLIMIANITNPVELVKKLFSETMKELLESVTSSKVQKLFGVPKSDIVFFVTKNLQLMIQELQNIVSDTLEIINKYLSKSTNKNIFFNKIFSSKSSKIYIKYTFIFFDYFFKLASSQILNTQTRNITNIIMMSTGSDLLKLISFDRVIDCLIWCNQNSPSIRKFFLSNKEKSISEHLITDAIIASSLISTHSDEHSVLGGIIEDKEGTRSYDLDSPIPDESGGLLSVGNIIQSVLSGVLYVLTVGKAGWNDYRKFRRDLYYNNKEGNTKEIAGIDPMTGHAYLIDPKITSVDEDLNQFILSYYLKLFYDELINISDLSPEDKIKLQEDKKLFETSGTLIRDLNIFKTDKQGGFDLKRDFLTFVLNNTDDPDIFAYLKTHTLKGISLNSDSAKNNIHTNMFTNFELTKSNGSLLSGSTDLKLIKNRIKLYEMGVKYNNFFDDFTTITVPDSYIFGSDTVNRYDETQFENSCDLNNLSAGQRQNLNDVATFIKDMMDLNSLSYNPPKTINIDLKKCSSDDNSIISEIKKLVGINDEDSLPKYIQFYLNDQTRPAPIQNEKEYIFKHDVISLLSSMNIAKLVYDGEGVDTVLDESKVFMQRRQIRYYDILGNICMKTIYVPKTFREFYSPNLELDTSLIEPVYAAINDKGSIISTSEKKKFHDMMDEIMDLHRKLSNGEQLIYYDSRSTDKLLQNLFSSIHTSISYSEYLRSQCNFISKKLLSSKFIGAYSRTLGLLDKNNIVLDRNYMSSITSPLKIPDEVSKQLISFMKKYDENGNMNINILYNKIYNSQGGGFSEDQVDIYTIIPLLFDPRTIKFIKTNPSFMEDADKQALDQLTEFLLKTGTGNLNQAYQSTSPGSLYQTLLENKGHLNQHELRTGISKFIYTNTFSSMLDTIRLNKLKDNSDTQMFPVSFTSNWTDNIEDYICSIICNIKEPVQFYTQNIEPVINIKYDEYNKKCSGSVCINNPLRLYNGNDMLMRHINQSLLKHEYNLELNPMQQKFIELIEHSNYYYKTDTWSTDFSKYILKAFGISTKQNGYVANNDFECQVTQLLYDGDDKYQRLRSVCNDIIDKEFNLPPKIESIDDEERLRVWINDEKQSKNWLKLMSKVAEQLNIPLNLITSIEQDRNQCKVSNLKENSELGCQPGQLMELSKNYQKLINEVRSKYVKNIPGTNIDIISTFYRREIQLRKSIAKFDDQEIPDLQSQLSDTLEYLREQMRMRNQKGPEIISDPVDFSSPIGSNDDINPPTASSTARDSSNANSAPQDLRRSANTQDNKVGKAQETKTEEDQKINEQMEEDIDERTSMRSTMKEEAMGESEKEIESETNSLMEALKEAFSNIADALDKMKSLGLRSRDKGTSQGPRDMQNLNDDEDISSDPSNIANKCGELSQKWSPSGKYDLNNENNRHISIHSSGSGLTKKQIAFIQNNCLTDSIFLSGYDNLNTAQDTFMNLFLLNAAKFIITASIVGLTACVYAVRIIDVVLTGCSIPPNPLSAVCLKTLTAMSSITLVLEDYFFKYGSLGESLNSHLSNEVTNTSNSVNMLFKTKFIYNEIFKKKTKLNTITANKKVYFMYNNIEYYKLNGEIYTNCNGTIEKLKLNQQSNQYEIIGTVTKKTSLNINSEVVLISDDQTEYSINDILNGVSDKDGNETIPDLEYRRMLLIQLYNIIGTKEYEDYAKIGGLDGFEDDYSFHALDDSSGISRRKFLETGFNRDLLQKLWGVSTINELRRNNNIPQKPSNQNDYDSIMLLKNYKCKGDVFTRFAPDGSIDLDGFSRNIEIFKNLISNSADDIESIIASGTLSDEIINEKVIELLRLGYNDPILSSFLYGDFSMQRHIMSIILKNKPDDAKEDIVSDSADNLFSKLKKTIDMSNNHDNYKKKIVIDNTNNVIEDLKPLLSLVMRNIPIINSTIKSLPGDWSSYLIPELSPDILDEFTNYLSKSTPDNTNQHISEDEIERFLCEEFMLKISNGGNINSQWSGFGSGFLGVNKLKQIAFKPCKSYGINFEDTEITIDPPFIVKTNINGDSEDMLIGNSENILSWYSNSILSTENIETFIETLENCSDIDINKEMMTNYNPIFTKLGVSIEGNSIKTIINDPSIRLKMIISNFNMDVTKLNCISEKDSIFKDFCEQHKQVLDDADFKWKTHVKGETERLHEKLKTATEIEKITINDELNYLTGPITPYNMCKKGKGSVEICSQVNVLNNDITVNLINQYSGLVRNRRLSMVILENGSTSKRIWERYFKTDAEKTEISKEEYDQCISTNNSNCSKETNLQFFPEDSDPFKIRYIKLSSSPNSDPIPYLEDKILNNHIIDSVFPEEYIPLDSEETDIIKKTTFLEIFSIFQNNPGQQESIFKYFEGEGGNINFGNGKYRELWYNFKGPCKDDKPLECGCILDTERSHNGITNLKERTIICKKQTMIVMKKFLYKIFMITSSYNADNYKDSDKMLKLILGDDYIVNADEQERIGIQTEMYDFLRNIRDKLWESTGNRHKFAAQDRQDIISLIDEKCDKPHNTFSNLDDCIPTLYELQFIRESVEMMGHEMFNTIQGDIKAPSIFQLPIVDVFFQKDQTLHSEELKSIEAHIKDCGAFLYFNKDSGSNLELLKLEQDEINSGTKEMREYGWVVGDHNNQEIILPSFLKVPLDTVYPQDLWNAGPILENHGEVKEIPKWTSKLVNDYIEVELKLNCEDESLIKTERIPFIKYYTCDDQKQDDTNAKTTSYTDKFTAKGAEAVRNFANSDYVKYARSAGWKTLTTASRGLEKGAAIYDIVRPRNEWVSQPTETVVRGYTASAEKYVEDAVEFIRGSVHSSELGNIGWIDNQGQLWTSEKGERTKTPSGCSKFKVKYKDNVVSPKVSFLDENHVLYIKKSLLGDDTNKLSYLQDYFKEENIQMIKGKDGNINKVIICTGNHKGESNSSLIQMFKEHLPMRLRDIIEFKQS